MITFPLTYAQKKETWRATWIERNGVPMPADQLAMAHALAEVQLAEIARLRSELSGALVRADEAERRESETRDFAKGLLETIEALQESLETARAGTPPRSRPSHATPIAATIIPALTEA